jgi:hypothetical protein
MGMIQRVDWEGKNEEVEENLLPGYMALHHRKQ